MAWSFLSLVTADSVVLLFCTPTMSVSFTIVTPRNSVKPRTCEGRECVCVAKKRRQVGG
jgi:hypothetical protein